MIIICFWSADYFSRKYNIILKILPDDYPAVYEYHTSQTGRDTHIILKENKISHKYLYKYKDDLTACLHYIYDSDENVIEMYGTIEDESGNLLYIRHSLGGEVVEEEFYGIGESQSITHAQ